MQIVTQSRNFNSDELFLLAIQMDLPSLLNFCTTDKRHNEFCNRDLIWNYKLNQDFPEYINTFNNLFPLGNKGSKRKRQRTKTTER